MVGFYGKNHVKSRKSARDTINVQRPDFGYDYSNWEYRNRIGTSNVSLNDKFKKKNHIKFLINSRKLCQILLKCVIKIKVS